MHVLKQIGLLLVFVLVGVLAGIGGRQVFATLNPPAPIETRDYRGLLAEHDAELLLFSTTTCPYCRKARAELDRLGVAYRDLVVDASADAERAFMALGEEGVPVLVGRDRLVRGFQPEAYRLLAAAVSSDAATGRSLAQASRRPVP